MLIHVRKNFNCNVFRNCRERALNIAVISNFQNDTFEKITIAVTEVILAQVSFLTVSSLQKNKNENEIP